MSSNTIFPVDFEVEQADIQASFKALIERKKKIAFVRPDPNDQDQTLEAVGVLLSQYFKWDGVKIMSVSKHALTDANFHDEADKIQEMITEVENGR